MKDGATRVAMVGLVGFVSEELHHPAGARPFGADAQPSLSRGVLVGRHGKLVSDPGSYRVVFVLVPGCGSL